MVSSSELSCQYRALIAAIVHISFIWMSVIFQPKTGHNRKKSQVMAVWITDPDGRVQKKFNSNDHSTDPGEWAECPQHFHVYSKYRHGNAEDRLFPQFYKCTARLFSRLSAVCTACILSHTVHQTSITCTVHLVLREWINRIKNLHSSESGFIKELLITIFYLSWDVLLKGS